MSQIVKNVEKWCDSNHLPDDHGKLHFFAVMNRAKLVIEKNKGSFTSDESFSEDIILAALLHDCDDDKVKKIIKTNRNCDLGILTEIIDYPITRLFINDLPEFRRKRIIQMISLVSVSKNGDTIDVKQNPSYYIPSDCDRIEGLGITGILRCFDVTKRLGNPIIIDKTPIPRDNKDIDDILIKRPLNGGKSESMIDHFFDKLLHLKPRSGNQTLINMFNKEIDIMRKWLLYICDCIPKNCTYEKFETLFLNKSVLTSLQNDRITYKDLHQQYFGLNIEGGYPGQDFKGQWVNIVLALDYPLAGRGNFDDLQKEVVKKNWPLLESGVVEIDERAFLKIYLAIIAHYSQEYTNIAVYVHQMPRDAKGLIKILETYLPQMKLPKDCKISFYHDNPTYKRGDAKDIKADILISFGQCASFEINKEEETTMVITDTFIPFDVKTNTIEQSHKYQTKNLLYPKFVIGDEYLSLAESALINYQSVNPAKQNNKKIGKVNIVSQPLLQVNDIWNPNQIGKAIDLNYQLIVQ